MWHNGDVGSSDPQFHRRVVWVFAAAFLFMGAVGLATGVTLGLFFAGFALSILCVPWAIVRETRWDRQVLLAACVIDAVALLWLVAAVRSEELTVWSWLRVYAVCLSVTVAQLGIVRLMIAAGPATAAGFCIFTTLAWLTAPLWLFPSLSPHAMQRVINVHPLFAINHAAALGVWTEAPIAYRLMNLNQDVFYAMPAGVLWCIVVHSVIGIALIWIKEMGGRSRDAK